MKYYRYEKFIERKICRKIHQKIRKFIENIHTYHRYTYQRYTTNLEVAQQLEFLLQTPLGSLLICQQWSQLVSQLSWEQLVVEVLPRNNIVLRRLSVQCELLNLKDKFMSKQIRKPKKLIKYYPNNQSFDIPDCKHIIQLYDHIVHSHCMKDFHLGKIYL